MASPPGSKADGVLLRVAAVQHAPRYLDVAGNLDRVEALLRDVEADLIVLPELFASGYFFHDAAALARVAEAEDGPVHARVRTWARSKDAVIAFGFAERSNVHFFNSARAIGPTGEVLLHYRKNHLFFEEKRWFEPGDRGFPVSSPVALPAGGSYRFGLMICFDWYFPEAARALALGGADVIAHPSNLVRKDCPRAMPIRALENRVFTVTTNRVGEDRRGEEVLQFIGQSLICSPEGEVLAAAGRSEEAVVQAAIDSAQAGDKRLNRYNDLFADRRPGAYQL